jgi:hypothetical protein
MGVGRPSDYSPEVADKICGLIADGQSLREICEADEMPDKATVFRWLDKHEEFRDQYARAREAQAEHWADEILEIADDGSNDWMERQSRDGSTQEVINSEHVTRSRLRVDSRKWLMSKLAPKKYGDRVDLTHAGPDGGPVKIEQIQRVIVDPKHSDSESVSPAPGTEPV